MINKQLTHVQKADSAVYETPSWLGRHYQLLSDLAWLVTACRQDCLSQFIHNGWAGYDHADCHILVL